jgi:hypothetical protein
MTTMAALGNAPVAAAMAGASRGGLCHAVAGGLLFRSSSALRDAVFDLYMDALQRRVQDLRAGDPEPGAHGRSWTWGEGTG